MVEFELEKGITDIEAVRLIESPPNSTPSDIEGWKEELSENTQTLKLGEGDNDGIIDDPFTARLLNLEVT